MADENDVASEGLQGEEDFALPSYSHWIFIIGWSSLLITGISIWYLRNFADIGSPRPSGSCSSAQAAYMLATLASINLMVMNAIVHGLAPAMHWNEAFFWRSSFCLIGAAPLCLLIRPAPPAPGPGPTEASPLLPGGGGKKDGGERAGPGGGGGGEDGGAAGAVRAALGTTEAMLAVRGVIGASAGVLLFVGMYFLPAAEAAALYGTAPFFSLLFAYLLLNETLSPWTIGGMVASFVGVVIILRPMGMVSWLWMGVAEAPNETVSCAALLTLGAGALVGLAGPTIRMMGARVRSVELVAWLGGVGVLMNLAIAALVQGGVHRAWAWAGDTAWGEGGLWVAAAWVGTLGMASFAGQICLNWSWQLETSATVTMVHMYLLLTLQLLFQIFVAQEGWDWVGIAGVVVVLAAGAAVVASRICAAPRVAV